MADTGNKFTQPLIAIKGQWLCGQQKRFFEHLPSYRVHILHQFLLTEKCCLVNMVTSGNKFAHSLLEIKDQSLSGQKHFFMQHSYFASVFTDWGVTSYNNGTNLLSFSVVNKKGSDGGGTFCLHFWNLHRS